MRKLFVFWGLLLAVLAGCKPTQYVPVTQYRDSIIVKTKTDSIRLIERDSIYVYSKKDTVFVERWKTKIQERFRDRIDTIRLTEIKEVPYPVEKEVPAVLSGLQKFSIFGFWIIVLGLVVFVGVKYKSIFKNTLKWIFKALATFY